jgi:DNA polymerase III epsilon subunit-like protein
MLLGCTPAGQNPGFDMRFLKQAYARAGRPLPKHDYHLIDVAVLAWPLQLAGLVPGVSLRHTAKFFGLGDQTHTAVSDLKQTLAVYRSLMNKYTRALFTSQ